MAEDSLRDAHPERAAGESKGHEPRRALNKADLFACGLGFTAITVGAIFFMAVPISSEGPVLCTFKRLTGIGCAGCGLTRSIGATAHLHFAEAVRWHIFGPIVVAYLILLWGQLGLSLATRKAWYPDPNARWLSLSVLAAMAVLLLYWGIRLAAHAVP